MRSLKKIIANLRLAQKFALLTVIGAVLVIPPIALIVNGLIEDRSFTQAELGGVAVSKPMIRVIQLTQQHRGLSARILGGQDGLESDRNAKQEQVAKALDVASKAIGQHFSGPKQQNRWQELSREWAALEKNIGERTVSGPESFTRHTALIAEYILNHDTVLDTSKISLDPIPATYYLQLAAMVRLPRLTELLGQTRAKGAFLLTRQQVALERRMTLTAILDQSAAILASIEYAFEKIFAVDKSSREVFSQPLKRVRKETLAIIELTRNQILNTDQLTYSASEFVSASTNTINQIFELNTLATEVFENRLNERQAASSSLSWKLFAFFALVISLGVWLIRVIASSIITSATAARDLALSTAEGDLTVTCPDFSDDEMGQLLGAMMKMQSSLGTVVNNVRLNADNVATASGEISVGNLDLSGRTEQQASALQETAASMAQLGTTVNQNAENAKQANKLAVGASEIAAKGGDTVSRVIETMEGIDDSSKRIVDIISVIDSIAFQTNILALNAAVEAARAGEQGRGFAVVAVEVRNLAQRSASAATEIKSLINASVEQVEHGSVLVKAAGETMEEIVTAVTSVTSIMSQISQASEEQSHGVSQVGVAVDHMDESTQQNAALVEQSAAAAESLKVQAVELVESMAVFKLHR